QGLDAGAQRDVRGDGGGAPVAARRRQRDVAGDVGSAEPDADAAARGRRRVANVDLVVARGRNVDRVGDPLARLETGEHRVALRAAGDVDVVGAVAAAGVARRQIVI